MPLTQRTDGWCSSRRPVNPLPLNCEAVGERFNSFTTHFPSGPVVYWLGHHPLKVKKGVRLPSGLFAIEVVSKHPRRGRCPIGSHKADLPGSIPGPGTSRAGWCSAEFHKLGGRGSTPGPANRYELDGGNRTARYANWHSGQVESLMSVGSTPTRAIGQGMEFTVPWSNGNDTSLTKRKRGFDSLRDDSIRFANEA